MNKKIFVLLVLMVIAILTIVIIAIKQKRSGQNSEITRQELLQKFQIIKSQYEKAKSLGLDISEIEELGKQAKKAFENEDYKRANELAIRMLSSLDQAGIPKPSSYSASISAQSNNPTPSAAPLATSLSFSKIKNAIVYERLGDPRPKRTIDEQIQILKDTKADLIFRAWWRWQPYPEKCSDVPVAQQQQCANGGLSYELFKNTIDEIKKERPNIIIISALPVQKIAETERNEITGEKLDKARTWAMIVDPKKWGLSMTKEEWQQKFGQSQQGYSGYYPDITNADFQDLFLSWAKKQIDMDINMIWIDLLYAQAGKFYQMTNDFNHPAVKESYDAATKIVDEIHKYGESKGKRVYVGSWTSTMYYPFTPPKLDFVTVAPTPQEIKQGDFNDKEWTDKKIKINNSFGEIPILIFFDWGYAGSQIETFVALDKKNKADILKKADKFFSNKDMIFIYPVHGGYLSSSPGWYDAMAPEIDVYEIIKEISQNKK